MGRRFEPVWAHPSATLAITAVNCRELGYILPMLLRLLESSRAGYPNRTGLNLCKVVVKYLALSTINWPRKNHIEIPKLAIESKVWKQYSAWLIFQLQYIRKRDWARTPLIRDVTLVQVDPVSAEDMDKIGTDALREIALISHEFSKCFRGLESKSYFNWLCRNHLMLISFEHCGASPYSDGLAVAEIGPGLGPVTSLLSKSTPKIYSYDTFEMQEVHKYVESMVIKPNERIQYHTTNLEINDKVKIPNEMSYFVIAFYSFTEVNLNEREKYFELIRNARYAIFATNQHFEGVSNFEYLENLAKVLNKKISHVGVQEIFGLSIPNYVKNHRVYLLHSDEVKHQMVER